MSSRSEANLPDRASHLISRACAWCATEFVVVRKSGRPRLYCAQVCRQRAYEHRHGFCHERPVRVLPGLVHAERRPGSGYERGGFGFGGSRVHAMRTSVRPEGRLRETLCGLLVAPLAGQGFTPVHPRACKVCCRVAARNPLQRAVSPSNELSRLRALLDEIAEERLDPDDAFRWICGNRPNPPSSRDVMRRRRRLAA
jgi:hypothetical protein